VAWTDDAGQGEAEIRELGGTPVSVSASTTDTGSSDLDTTYEATFTGLTPSTDYEYRVQSGGSWSGWISTRTAPPAGSCVPFRFVAVGDGRGESVLGLYVQSQQWPGVMDYISQEDPLLVIHSGDYVDEGTEAGQWADELADLPAISEQAPFFLALGNHDDGPGEGEGAYFNKLFAQPRNNPDNVEDYFSFIVGNVQFIALNTENFDMDAQILWMEDELAAHQDDVDWRIVFFHRPIWSSGAHGSNEDDVPRASVMVPVLEAYGVDLVLNGHDHDYERFHPSIGGFTQPRQINPLPFDNETRGEAEGVIYIVTGGAGALVNPIFDVTEEGSAYGDNHIHYLVLEVAGDTLSLTARDLGSQGLGQPQLQGDMDGITLEKSSVVCTPVGPDGGTDPDGGVDGGGFDGGQTDGGVTDGEPPAQDAASPDGAPGPDGSMSGGSSDSGCSCTAARGQTGIPSLLVLLLLGAAAACFMRATRRRTL
jgi:predicted MPP superfamily phosphohydrolase